MQQQSPGRFRRFAATALGKTLLIALAIVVVFASYVYVYVGTLVAIPAMLLFGLAVPIWLGLKSPRYLALSGLVILLIVAPISNAVISQDVMTPIGASASNNVLPDGNGGSVLQNALVTPYVGGTSTNFTWSVSLFPLFVPKGNSSPLWVNLYVSTCPGAISNSTCPGGSPPYSFFELNWSPPANDWNVTTHQFQFVIGSEGIWDWQMSAAVTNNATHALYDIFLVGDPTYNAIEGPVIGTYATVYTSLLLTVYLDQLLFLGAPFYFVLLIYVIFKRRERARQDAAARAAAPPSEDETGPSTPVPSKPPSKAAPSAKEGSCPSCGAVVYAGEKTCWKCGASLSPPSGSAPLASGNSP